MEPLEFYLDARDKFAKKTLYTSGIAILMAAASRLPSWEVGSSQTWLIGTVNVGFLHIFGPIIIFGLFCNMYLSLKELIRLKRSLLENTKADDSNRWLFDVTVLPPKGFESSKNAHKSVKIARFSLKAWVLIIPLAAYLILFISYLDFVRPSDNDPLKWKYPDRGRQVIDLFFGIGGWQGFKPLAPSIQGAWEKKDSKALSEDERQKIKEMIRNIPYIYPPFQTWVYLAGFILLIYMARFAWWDSNRITETHTGKNKKEIKKGKKSKNPKSP